MRIFRGRSHRVSNPALFAAMGVLFLLWLPGFLHYLPWNDTAIYALLGRDFWEHGTYTLFGEPNARHLPLHAIFSYPFVRTFGIEAGMQFSTLTAGIAVLITSYALLARTFSKKVASLGVLLLSIHHGFVLMTMQGSADLLFAAFFLLSLHGFIRAEDDTRWYILAGIAAGLACLTRYNGAALFPLFGLWILWKRSSHLRSPWFWSGMCIGGALFSLWFLRNALTFGNPFFTDYTRELSEQSPSMITQLLSNTIYYVNPLHNILPILLALSFYGIIRLWKPQLFLLLAIGAAVALSSIWWVQGTRFIFPAVPLLIGFAVAGMFDLSARLTHTRFLFLSLLTIAIVSLHGASLCLYSYGACNAWFDRTIGIIPPHLGLSPEGMYGWLQVRDYINQRAETGAFLIVDTNWNAAAWSEGIFRPDIIVIDEQMEPVYDRDVCPAYSFQWEDPSRGEIVFMTEDIPVKSVYRKSCPTP